MTLVSTQAPRTVAAPASPWAVFAVAAAAVFLVALDATIVLAAFPALRTAFPATTPADLSWVLNAYTVTYAALLVPAGRFADTHGRRRVFLGGLVVFGIASVLCGLAPDPGVLVGFRVLQAVGAAALTPASLALVLAAFPAEKRAAAVGLWGAVGALAAAFGPAVGGALTQAAGWQAVFLVNAPLVAIGLLRGAAKLAESRRDEAGAPVDGVGIALIAAGVGTIVLALVEADAWPVSLTVATAAGGLLLLGAFVGWARGRPGAALDLSLFAERSYVWANAATLVFGAAFSLMFLGFFLFLTGVWHLGLGTAGLLVTPGPLAVVPVAVLAGRTAARVGHRPLLVVGGLVFAASNLWFLARLGTEPAIADWIAGLVLGGIGVGLVLPALGGAAAARLAPTNFGAGNAANAAIRQVGSALGAALAILVAGRPDAGLPAFHLLHVLLIAGGIATALLSLPVDTRPGGRQTGPRTVGDTR